MHKVDSSPLLDKSQYQNDTTIFHPLAQQAIIVATTAGTALNAAEGDTQAAQTGKSRWTVIKETVKKKLTFRNVKQPKIVSTPAQAVSIPEVTVTRSLSPSSMGDDSSDQHSDSDSDGAKTPQPTAIIQVTPPDTPLKKSEKAGVRIYGEKILQYPITIHTCCRDLGECGLPYAMEDLDLMIGKVQRLIKLKNNRDVLGLIRESYLGYKCFLVCGQQSEKCIYQPEALFLITLVNMEKDGKLPIFQRLCVLVDLEETTRQELRRKQIKITPDKITNIEEEPSLAAIIKEIDSLIVSEQEMMALVELSEYIKDPSDSQNIPQPSAALMLAPPSPRINIAVSLYYKYANEVDPIQKLRYLKQIRGEAISLVSAAFFTEKLGKYLSTTLETYELLLEAEKGRAPSSSLSRLDAALRRLSELSIKFPSGIDDNSRDASRRSSTDSATAIHTFEYPFAEEDEETDLPEELPTPRIVPKSNPDGKPIDASGSLKKIKEDRDNRSRNTSTASQTKPTDAPATSSASSLAAAPSVSSTSAAEVPSTRENVIQVPSILRRPRPSDPKRQTVL